jgi:hypothetical protein
MDVPLEELHYVLHKVDDFCHEYGKDLRTLLHQRGILYIVRPHRFHAAPAQDSAASRALPMEVYEVKTDRSGEVIVRIPNKQN